MEEVTIQKLVYGGQGLAELQDGRKVFVWNALPGEQVQARFIKRKRSYAEAIAEEIIEVSSERRVPREANYLATSPWQMMVFEAENRHKTQIIHELFAHENVTLPDVSEIVTVGPEWHYRNKMEYSFWGDENGLHLALYRRGSHGKQIVEGSELALPVLDRAAQAVLFELQNIGLRAGDLKTIVVRCSQENETVAALYTKTDNFPKIGLPSGVKGLRVYYSDPKSPASVATRLLCELGDTTLQDDILGKTFMYTVDSFFQVNLPVYEKALTRIREYCMGDPIDMYAGVGSIGLSVAQQQVELVELDPTTVEMARVNAAKSGLITTVTETSTEKALAHIEATRPVVFDPPRAGLHSRVVERCLEVVPPQVIYLSCNPATQARDLVRLQGKYKINFFEIYNFFPKTPHIETLAILTRK
ncbi:MAG TPA: TRAM domain-containing protein [Verrucomicrobiae bacterium]|nr:TRAM domain-containing protein [Verrucomicrobiae bacterium]